MMFTVTPERGLTVINHPTDPTYVWHGVDDDLIEFRYVVTQGENEGPEYMEYRPLGMKNYNGEFTVGVVHKASSFSLGSLSEWIRWNDAEDGEPPDEVQDHFFGTVLDHKQTPIDASLNRMQITNCLSFLQEKANGITELREALEKALAEG